MGVTKVKGKTRPWKVYYYEIESEGGRQLRKRRARYFLSRTQADSFWHMKTLEYEAFTAGLSSIIPKHFDKFIDEMIEGYFKYKSPTYLKGEKGRLANIAERWRGVEMHRVRPADLQAFLFQLTDQGLASHTVKNYHGLLSLLFKQAKLRQFISENPMERVPAPKVVARREVTALSEIELAKVLRCKSDIKPVILFLIHTGLRLSELLRVRVERDCDFGANSLRVRSIENEATKNKKWRVIPLTEVARGILADMRVGQVWEGTGRSLDNQLRKLGAEIGVHLHAHRFRHTFCSLNMANGVPEAVVQSWLGHGSATITKRYTHLLGHDQRWATLDVGREFLEAPKKAGIK